MSFRQTARKGGKKYAIKIGKAKVYVSGKVLGVMALGSIGAFFGLLGFLYWLWYIRLPELSH